MRQKCIAQSLAFVCTFHETSDIDDIQKRRNTAVSYTVTRANYNRNSLAIYILNNVNRYAAEYTFCENLQLKQQMEAEPYHCKH